MIAVQRACLTPVLAVAFVVACASPSAPSTAAKPAPQPTAAGEAALAPAPPTIVPPPATVPPAPRKLRVASQFGASDLAHFIAVDRGYYAQQGLDVELFSFASSSEMIPALATDQVEVGGIGGNPAMWNAVARGVRLKILLDKGSTRPGRPDTSLLVRKELHDSGRVLRLDDLRGLRVAFTPPGKATGNAVVVDYALQKVGLQLDDLALEALPFPDMVAALANGAVDGAAILEPFQTRALRQGTTARLMGLDEMYVDFTFGLVGVSRAFFADRPAAKALSRAYITALRDYDNAVGGRTSAVDRAQLDEIVAKYTRIDVATVREMAPAGLHPNGRVNVEALKYGYRWFRERGFIPEPVSDSVMDELWGMELVDEVLAEIGRVPES